MNWPQRIGSALMLAALIALPVWSGCRHVVQVAPGADPIVVVAEWTAENAALALDEFLAWERAHEATLAETTPALHAAAEAVRASAPDQLRELRRLTRAYKRDKTDAAGGAVRAATHALLGIANAVRGHMGLPALAPPVIPKLFTPEAAP